jgi:hypothetical protein
MHTFFYTLLHKQGFPICYATCSPALAAAGKIPALLSFLQGRVGPAGLVFLRITSTGIYYHNAPAFAKASLWRYLVGSHPQHLYRSGTI